MNHKVTGTQPEPVKQKIYGSGPVKPLDAPSDQPKVLPHIKVYGGKKPVTVRVRIRASDRDAIINEADFDDAVHERLG